MPRRIFLLERLDTPTGRLLIVTDDSAEPERPVRAVDWEDHEHRLQRLLRIHYGTVSAAFQQRYGASTAGTQGYGASAAGPQGFELREAPSRLASTGSTRPASKSRSNASRALEAYFDGNLNALTDLPTATNGTEFQRTVWTALRRIPPGQTISYRTLAEEIHRPTATRAVGLANGSNPISIIVPCHRVIGSNNALTGYGGGLERKRWLLAHEGVQMPL
jgi:methylated-DNA-[protein]-cysteine S-methyltransferase